MPNQNTGVAQLARKQQPRHDQSFKYLEKHAKRDELAEILGVSDDSRVVTFVTYLLSPNRRLQKCSLATLAAMCELSYSELLKAITSARVSEGVLRMGQHLPKMMEDAVIDAQASATPCKVCKGTGQIIHLRKRKKGDATIPYVDCWNCGATGQIRVAGDKDARSLVFESIGLTNRKSPLFNINLNKERPGELPSVESEMGGIDKVLEIKPMKSKTA